MSESERKFVCLPSLAQRVEGPGFVQDARRHGFPREDCQVTTFLITY